MNKKKLLSLALVVVLIATISFGTLAWFNDKDEVTNTFMVANSGEPTDPDDIFSVDVQEKIDTDGDGNPDTTVSEGKDEVDKVGETYKDILPGSKLSKEPVIVNTGSYPQYIRVHVTTNNADAWIAALGNGYDLGKMFVGHDEAKWERYDVGVYNGENNTYTMTFYLKAPLDAKDSVSLFTHVQIPTDLDQTDMTFIGGQFKLSIVAEAVQTENLGEGVDSAVEAFKVVEASHENG